MESPEGHVSVRVGCLEGLDLPERMAVVSSKMLCSLQAGTGRRYNSCAVGGEDGGLGGGFEDDIQHFLQA